MEIGSMIVRVDFKALIDRLGAPERVGPILATRLLW